MRSSFGSVLRAFFHGVLENCVFFCMVFCGEVVVFWWWIVVSWMVGFGR